MTKKSPICWLNRYGCPMMPFMCLVLTPDELARVESKLGTGGSSFPNTGARTITYDRRNGSGITCVIALSEQRKTCDLIQVQALLVHEAVHVWQKYIADINEPAPGIEQEAYAVQYLSELLMREYDRRLKLEAANV